MRKALSEPHYCETYADLVYLLKEEMKTFPGADADSKRVTLKSVLLTICQTEFESINHESIEMASDEVSGMDKEEIEFQRKKKKERVLATMKFIGHLFLRSLLTSKIIGGVIQDLAMCNDAGKHPQEHIVECIVELLTSIGYTLDQGAAGQMAIQQVCGRLLELKLRKDKGGKKGIYSSRVQFMIQDMLESKNNGWMKKIFKAVAKTKDEIHADAKRDEKQQKIDGSELIIMGQRPAWVTAGKEGKADAPSRKDEGSSWNHVASKPRR